MDSFSTLVRISALVSITERSTYFCHEVGYHVVKHATPSSTKQLNCLFHFDSVKFSFSNENLMDE